MTKYFNLVVVIVLRYEGQADEENKTENAFYPTEFWEQCM